MIKYRQSKDGFIIGLDMEGELSLYNLGAMSPMELLDEERELMEEFLRANQNDTDVDDDIFLHGRIELPCAINNPHYTSVYYDQKTGIDYQIKCRLVEGMKIIIPYSIIHNQLENPKEGNILNLDIPIDVRYVRPMNTPMLNMPAVWHIHAKCILNQQRWTHENFENTLAKVI